MLLEDYFQDRTLYIVVSGQSTGPLPVRASVPQRSVLGPVLWNIYIDDLLLQLLTVAAYANDCKLSRSFCRLDSRRAVDEMNKTAQTGGTVGRVVAGYLSS